VARVVDQQRDHRLEVESRLAAVMANVTVGPGVFSASPGMA
jgi:hypothetical protein